MTTSPKKAKPGRAKKANIEFEGDQVSWQSQRLALGARTVGKSIGTTMVPESIQLRGGSQFESVERPYLYEYERALRNDPYLHRMFNFIALTMLSSLGDYTHPDPKAKAFIDENNLQMERSFHVVLGGMIYAALWAGCTVGEKVFVVKKGLLYLERITDYHPASIWLVPDREGRLTDNKKNPAHPFLPRTGIWQRLPSNWLLDPKYLKRGEGVYLNYVRIPKAKTVLLTHNGRHGNWAGESALSPIWRRYEMTNETWKNLLITTERYGSPQIAVIVPRATTDEVIQNADGTTVFKSLAQKTSEQMGNLNSSQGIVVEEPVGLPNNEKVRFQNISSFNNFGQNYLDTIDHLYRDIMIGLGVPPLLFLEHGAGLSAGTIAKVHAETYKQFMISLYKEFVEPFVKQVHGQLLALNFGITDPGAYAFNPFDLSAADTLMNILDKATQSGFIDPSQEEDLQQGRTLLGLPLASLSTVPQRLKDNRKLMDRVRRPDIDQIQIAKIRAQSMVEHGELLGEARVEAAEVTAEAQQKVASVNAQSKKHVEGKKLDFKHHELSLKTKLEKSRQKAQSQAASRINAAAAQVANQPMPQLVPHTFESETPQDDTPDSIS